MNNEISFRLLYAGVTALIVGIGLGIGFVMRESRGRYSPIYMAAFLPLILFLCVPLLMLLRPESRGILLSLSLHALISAAIYALLLYVLTPLLRKRLSAEGCAALWVLPNMLLYWCMSTAQFAFGMQSRFLIRLPRALFRVLLGIWAAGFVGVLVWRIVSHLRFRRSLLRAAAEAGEREQALLKELRGALKAKNSAISPKLRVYYSPAAKSPLSVGLLRRSTCLVLPQRSYSDGELRLIFRHELIHLLHQDNHLKLTLTVILAAGWFVPSLWAGIGRAGEELELCCDELAVEGLDEAGRRQYANLLLKNSGTARGFTTCLSATASGLRYRMARILHPKKRRFGFLLAAALSALFAFCFGLVGFSLEAGSFRDEILDRNGGGWQIAQVVPWTQPFTAESSADPALCAAAETALADRALSELPGQIRGTGEELGYLRLTRPAGGEDESSWAHVTVYDSGMLCWQENVENAPRVWYQLREPPELGELFAAAAEPPAQ